MSTNETSKGQQPDYSVHAFCDDSLGTLDAVGMVEAIKSKAVSAEELVKDAQARAKKVNPALHAIASEATTPSKTNSTGFFAGIPSYIKDNVEVEGLPTGYGTNAMKAKQSVVSGDYAKQYLSTGVTILGKSSLPEFGFNATTEPSHTHATVNPWHTDYSSGASSGGAGALVASGVVPFAHGNDGGGSIRIPASCCGLIGLKPSRGRHINEKATKGMPIKIISEGIVSRSVRDTAYFHYELQRYYQNHHLPHLPLIKNPGKKRLRIGYYTDSVTGFSTDNDTRAVIAKTVQSLSDMGHHVEEIKFPVSARFADDFALYWGFLAFMLSKTAKYSLDKEFDKNKLDGLSKGLAKHYKRQFHCTPFFLKRLKQHGLEFRQGFQKYDAYLSPVLGQSPRPLGELHPDTPFESLMERLSRYASFTPMANVAGTPAISLPMGASQKGIPIGVQLGADIGHESTLIELAYELEELGTWGFLYG